MIIKYSKRQLKKDLLREAKALGIQPGAAETIARQTIAEITPWVKKQSMITEDDLNRMVAKKVKKYHADLAYVYQNRGKII